MYMKLFYSTFLLEVELVSIRSARSLYKWISWKLDLLLLHCSSQFMTFCQVTLNCIRYPALPLVHNGGFHGTPPEKTTFPPEFLNYLYTISIYTNHNHISGKKIQNICTVSKWRPNNQFSFRVISISAKIWKPTFPKEFFNEIWLKLGDHEYINTAEIKFG